MKRGTRRAATALGITLVTGALLPGYLRAYSVSGDSDAPAYVTGDRVIVNLAAYDVRVPYSRRVIAKLGNPVVGDMVLFRDHDDRLAMKRVVAGPGERVAMEDNHLIVDGRTLRYRPASDRETTLLGRGSPGTTIEIEESDGLQVAVSYTPGLGRRRSFEPVEVPEGTFFLLGSSRDVSVDSREYGPVRRDRILGRVIGRVWTYGRDGARRR